jgi:hypothetical protein
MTEPVSAPKGTVMYRVTKLSRALLEAPIEIEDYEDTVVMKGDFSTKT